MSSPHSPFPIPHFSSPDRWATAPECRATGADRWATSAERWATSAERWATVAPKALLSAQETPPPPSPVDAPQAATVARPTAAEQEEEVLSNLITEGLTLGIYTERTIRDAIARTSTTHVAAILDHYRQQQPVLGPGALTVRLQRARPSLAITSGWPPIPHSPFPIPHSSLPRDPALELRQLEYRIITAGRRAGAPQAEIDRRLQLARERFSQTKE